MPSSATSARYLGLRPVSAIARACSGSRAASVTSCPRSSQHARERRPPGPRSDDDGLHARLHEVDRHGHALELEPLAELVLDPVAVVARDQAGVVDEEAEAGRAHGGLGAVEEVQALSVSGRRLADLPQLAEEAVQLAGRDRATCTCRRAPRPGRGSCRPRASSSPRRRRSAGAGGGAARAARARPRSRPRAMSHFESTTSVEDIDLRATSAIDRSCSTTPSLESTRTSATSARSAAWSARSSE